jgi:hypothetical protein
MIRRYGPSIRGIIAVPRTSPRTIDNRGNGPSITDNYRSCDAAERDSSFAGPRQTGEALALAKGGAHVAKKLVGVAFLDTALPNLIS